MNEHSRKSLEKLIEGNVRYREERSECPRRGAQRRAETADGQNPFAVILCCSDSRVVPEIIFDQGIGDLFVVRVAGNVVDDVVLGSIEYAVGHLDVPLVMVLGHKRCGAVNEAMKEEEPEGHTAGIISFIRKAVESGGTFERQDSGRAERSNVSHVAGLLRRSTPLLENLADKGRLDIVRAIYDIGSGEVEVY